MKWYQGFDRAIVVAVLLCGLTCLIIGIFWGKSIGEHKHRRYISECILKQQRNILLEADPCNDKILEALWMVDAKNWEKLNQGYLEDWRR